MVNDIEHDGIYLIIHLLEDEQNREGGDWIVDFLFRFFQTEFCFHSQHDVLHLNLLVFKKVMFIETITTHDTFCY